MHSTARRIVTLTLLSLAAACGSDDSQPITMQPPPPPPPPSGRDGLWTVSGVPSGILQFAPALLAVAGDHAPTMSLKTTSAQLFVSLGIAFDRTGSLWISSQEDAKLIRLSPERLGQTTSSAASVVISATQGSLDHPAGIAFDASHHLWVANRSSGTLVRFDEGQLEASGSPAPSITIAGAGRPTGLAFDAAGGLWVSDNQGNTLKKYSAAQLRTSGSPAPEVVLNDAATRLVNPAGLAFDTYGNLWVANTGNQRVFRLTPTQLAPHAQPSTSIVLGTDDNSLVDPVGLAFDKNGSLWVMNVSGVLEQFAPAQLLKIATPTPTTTIRMPDFNLLLGLAFWPVPAGLPLR
ncbi:MAG: NHL repeat-containing protein [Gemmatimonadales bacterium]